MSQVNHVEERYRRTWVKYCEAKDEMDRQAKEVKTQAAIIRQMENNEQKDLWQIHDLNKKQDELIRRLRKSQDDFLRVCQEVKRAKDSISVLTTRNKELTVLADSFSLALKEEKIVTERLSNEKKQLEKLLYFVVNDLTIAEIENSYFSSFDIGYKKPLNGEIIYSENSKDLPTKALFSSLEYIRFTGTVYTPPATDTLEGFILIYINDVLYDQIHRRYHAESQKSNYCFFEIDEKDVKLNKKIRPRSNIKIAFVTEESFQENREDLKDFHKSYRSGFFVISSIRPEASGSAGDEYYKTLVPGGNELPAYTDTYTVNTKEISIRFCTNGNTPSGELISLETTNTMVNKIKLVRFDQNPFTGSLELNEGVNLIKIKALSESLTNKGCHLWVYTLSKDGDILRKKLTVLKKGELLELSIRYDPLVL